MAAMLWAAALAGAVVGNATAADWPTYGHDAARSHGTAEKLAFPLQPAWTWQSAQPPRPAWGDPKTDPVEAIQELRRIHFDDVFQPVVAGGALYFGSSVDCHVYCLDAASGRQRWRFLTGGPVRLAPCVAGQRVYFSSDDGYAYCLAAADGSLLWRFRAAPEDRRVLGNGRLISLWPARTGVLVDGGVAYFGAGIFPAEGVFLYAVDAATGREIWRNDTGGEAPQSRISPQGYLLASAAMLYAPMGRVSPAAFNRQTGRLEELTYFGKEVGGTYALISEHRIYTGTEEIVSYPERTGPPSGPPSGQPSAGDRFVIFGGRKVILAGNMAYVAGDKRLYGLDRAAYPQLSRKLKSLLNNGETISELVYQPRKELGQVKRDIAQLTGDSNSAKVRADRAALEKKAATLQKTVDDLQAKAAVLKKQIAAARQDLKTAFRWDIACDVQQELVLAGDTLLGGGDGAVTAVDCHTGQVVWSAEVNGTAKGLAVAGGRLYVSTDKGQITSFGPAGTPNRETTGGLVAQAGNSIQAGQLANPGSQLAEARPTGRGYCLVYGCETGELAIKLAGRYELVYAVSDDDHKVAAARKAAEAAGVLGSRVMVEQWPLERVPYPDYFANVVISESLRLKGTFPGNVQEMWRMVKPCGGVAFMRPLTPSQDTPEFAVEKLPPELQKWYKSLPAGEASITSYTTGSSARAPFARGEPRPISERIKIEWGFARGPLSGAGSWTHLYADAGNTACGDDTRVKAPFSVLWFGEPGPHNMVNRHVRSVGPLSSNGTVYCQGENIIMAFDAYNGVKYWEKPIEGAMRTGVSNDSGNMVLTKDALYVAARDVCYRLDPASGHEMAVFQLPPGPDDGRPRKWGYLACDGRRLFGTRVLVPAAVTAAQAAAAQGTGAALFALDPQTGEVIWQRDNLRVQHNSIAIGDGRIYLVDNDPSPLAKPQRASKADVRTVLALDAATGRELWKTPVDVNFGAGGTLATMYHDGALVLFNVYSDGHYWQQFFAGEFAGRRVTVLFGQDGHVLWSKPLGYRVRPLIVGDTLHAEPWAFDLWSGQAKTRVHPVTGQADDWQFARPGHHCGCPSAAPACLFFRSFCLGYYDLLGDFGTQHFGGQRPGCWINFIPANGLLLMPEASAGCMCPFPNMCTVVFEPVQRSKGYSYYSAQGPLTPVRRLGLKLGAPGDRTDAAGNLWLGFPRPGGSLVLPLKIQVSLGPGGRYIARSSDYTPIAGTPDPWLFTSAALGLSRCTLPLLGHADGTALYRVRLAFADPDNDRPGRRTFDVKLQGRIVAADFDIAAEAGGRDRALFKTFDDVEVSGDLVVELVPHTRTTDPAALPVLQGIEVVRQRVTSLGCAVPELEFSMAVPKRTTAVELANIRDDDFHGRLELTPPAGFAVAPRSVPVTLPAGQRLSLPLEVTMADTVPVGRHALGLRLVAGDGRVDVDRQAWLENLGRRGRMTVRVAQDSYVARRYPDLNKGKATTLLVDGGDREVGDLDHSLAYLKFRLDVPGSPLSARLRLFNAGNPTVDAGRVCLVEGPWDEMSITYNHRPPPGAEVARLGRVSEFETVDVPLKLDLAGRRELSLVLDPTNTDGVDYFAREGGKPAELVIEYELP